MFLPRGQRVWHAGHGHWLNVGHGHKFDDEDINKLARDQADKPTNLVSVKAISDTRKSGVKSASFILQQPAAFKFMPACQEKEHKRVSALPIDWLVVSKRQSRRHFDFDLNQPVDFLASLGGALVRLGQQVSENE